MHSITSLYHKEMKKNTIIIVLAVLVAMFGLYSFCSESLRTDQAAAETIRQQQIAEEKEQ